MTTVDRPDPASLDVDAVLARLGDGDPDRTATHPDAPWQAAVAVVLAPGDDGLGVAFIERVERAGDRWSGQMALPGGKREPDDRDLAETAVRETAEEVGVVLPDPVGRLPDQRGRSSRGLVTPFLFTLDRQPPLTAQPTEVRAADWIALSWLFDPDNAVRYRWLGVPFPGIAHEGRIIWGLTHRILGDLAEVLGLRLPRP